MNFIIHRIILSLVFLTGTTIFVINAANREFLLSIFALTTAAFFVNLYGFFTKSLSTRELFYVLSLSFVFVSIAVFGNYGIEQKAIEYETLYQFSLDGILIGFLMLFLSSIFFVIGKAQEPYKQNNIHQMDKLKPSQTAAPKLLIQSDKWEEASQEDLESGEFQAV